MKTLIISTGFADLELRDGELWNQMTFCHADTVTDQAIEVSISDAATQAIKPIATPVEVTEVDGELHVSAPATPTADRHRAGRPRQRDAARPTRTTRASSTPTATATPGVTSTVKVSEDLQGEIYLARREIFAYDVTQVDPDRLEGTITDSSEQLILGASDPAFLTPAQWVQVDDPALQPGDLGARRRRLGLRPTGRGARRPLPAQPQGRLVTDAPGPGAGTRSVRLVR